jgi:hypothetical protein
MSSMLVRTALPRSEASCGRLSAELLTVSPNCLSVSSQARKRTSTAPIRVAGMKWTRLSRAPGTRHDGCLGGKPALAIHAPQWGDLASPLNGQFVGTRRDVDRPPLGPTHCHAIDRFVVAVDS